MDRLTRTANIIKSYYNYKQSHDAAFFVKEVCQFFDYIKDQHISEQDLSFLLFLANEAGMPQYYDLLKRKFTTKEISDESINMLTLSALFHDSSLLIGDNKLHRYQKRVLDSFIVGQNNRYVLTAPTSFGKTFLVYEIVQKMKYRNILLVFPAISLLSENYTRLCNWDAFKEYEIHSLSEEEFDPEGKNIFIFTPERYLSFMDRNKHVCFDFAFVDEIYKIDNTFVLDSENAGENERDTAYRLALEYICKNSNDMLLAGPYMELPDDAQAEQSFQNFAVENSFAYLRFNHFEIVGKDYTTIKGRRNYSIDDMAFEIGNISKWKKIANIINAISSPKENTIVYCGRRSDTESYAKQLLSDQALISSFQEKCAIINSPIYNTFLAHLERVFGADWIVLKALKARIGIHHSLIPKYIQKEIINLFNEGALICLFSTTTITEGVNTSAKNIIITTNKKGIKNLRQFDAKNIAGRAGRFHQHFSGRVIDLDNGFEDIVNGAQEILEHKNYDVNKPKNDVDYQITKDKYLSENDRQAKAAIQAQIDATGIPRDVFDCFRVVGPKDKLSLYSTINKMPWWTIEEISRVSTLLAQSNAHKLHWDGFQTIMDLIYPIVREDKLKQLISIRTGTQQKYSLITVLLNNYLSGGFLGMVDYYVTRPNNPKTKDEAVRSVADSVYNVFKYHLVKYLGLFDGLFRYHVSTIKGVGMEDIAGLGLLLQKLEYNALSPKARKLSDYGVPFSLIEYYDNRGQNSTKVFDAYEKHIDEQIGRLIP